VNVKIKSVVLSAIIASTAFILGMPLAVPAATATPTSTAWTVQMTPASTTTNVQISISFIGLQVESAVQLKLMPTDLVVGDGFSSSDGTASFEFGVPATLTEGTYTIAVAGITSTDSSFTAEVAAFSVSETGLITDTTLRDGPLSLEVTSDATASFGAPYLMGYLSVTDGALGYVSVRDERVVSRPGWILYASVDDFHLSTDESVLLPKNQLGISPVRLAPESTAEGVELGLPTRPGLATYPMLFAEAEPGAMPGVTTLDATLRLVAPPYLPVGTYVSTVTLTLVSK
jgi:hypothetical protein